jgi:hypothetical protein
MKIYIKVLLLTFFTIFFSLKSFANGYYLIIYFPNAGNYTSIAPITMPTIAPISLPAPIYYTPIKPDTNSLSSQFSRYMANQQNLFNQELNKKNTETRKVIEKIKNDYHNINKNIEQIQSYSESFKNTDFPILDNPTISLTSENDHENEETTAKVQIYKNEAQQKLTANIPHKNGYFRDETPSQVTNRINQGLNSTDYFVAESQVNKAVELYGELIVKGATLETQKLEDLKNVTNAILDENGFVKEYVTNYPKLQGYKLKTEWNGKNKYRLEEVTKTINSALHILKNSYSPTSIEKAEIAIENALKADEWYKKGNSQIGHRYYVRAYSSLKYISGKKNNFLTEEKLSNDSKNYFDFSMKADTYENYSIIDLSNTLANKLNKNFSNENLLFADLSLKEAEFSAKINDAKKFEVDLDKGWAAVDFLAGAVTGAVNAGANAFIGTVDALIHPADTAIVLGKLAIYSPQIAPYLYNKILETASNYSLLSAKEKGELIGSMSFEIAGMIIPATKSAKFSNLASDLARATNKTLLDEYTLIAERIKGKPPLESLGTQYPYNSWKIREELQGIYGKENVISSTVPPLNKPNVKLAGKEKLIQIPLDNVKIIDGIKVVETTMQDVRIVFDHKGFPIFDDVAKVEIRIPVEEFRNVGYVPQMKLATVALNESIEKGLISKSGFTNEQIVQIKNGEPSIKGYTWHHHQDTGRIQLVLTNIHNKVKHIG